MGCITYFRNGKIPINCESRPTVTVFLSEAIRFYFYAYLSDMAASPAS